MFRYMPLWEKALALLLLVVIGIFSTQVFFAFRDANSIEVPAEGGVYTEGLVGKIGNLNPLLARTSADRDISNLIFAGLTRFNPQTGEIEGDLATYILSDNKRTYTFRLKENIYWHDGEPITADDVIYTYKTVLQNPLFKNHFLQDAFKDVTVERTSPREIMFTLKTPYAFFLSNLTVGILPKHVLELVPVENLDKSDFSLSPIGSGPYMFSSIDVGVNETKVLLKRFDTYHFGAPYIDSVAFRIFPTEDDLIANMSSLTGVKSVPHDALSSQNGRLKLFNVTLPQYSAVFLNTSSPIFSQIKTRFALLLATDKQAIVDALGTKDFTIVDTPILESKENLDIEYNELRAKGAFFDTEWKMPEGSNADLAILDGKESVKEELEGFDRYRLTIDRSLIRRNKEDKPLEIRLITSKQPPEYLESALMLQKQWAKAGVDTIVEAYDTEILHENIAKRDFDALLFGQNLGYNLDPFPFWHSSQAETGLNLSKFKSFTVDKLLTDIRSTFDQKLKRSRLNELKNEIARETPAIFLFTPIYHYGVDAKIQGVESPKVSLESDRLNLISTWYVRKKKVFKEDVSLADFWEFIYNHL